MGFSQHWEQRYAANTHLSIWPWSDIVSLVHRHCKSTISAGNARVLELGCGAGANIPLFANLGMDYHAVEGSQTAVEQLQRRYPQFAGQIMVGDFTVDLPFQGNFDVIIDRASLTHNSTAAIAGALQLAYHALAPGGTFIGSDWFSTQHDDFKLGNPGADPLTRTGYTTGSFAGVGTVHFSDERHLRELFAAFEIVFLEEKLTRRHEPKDPHQFAAWNIVARKSHD